MATINTLNTWTNVASTVWDFGSTKITYYLDAIIVSQDTANNKSYIKTRLRSELHYGWANSQNYTFTCSYAPTVSGTNSWYSGTETITESTANNEIPHENDGSKTITLTARAYMSGVGDTTFSGQATLKSIPRASKINSITNSISSDGNTVKVKVNFTKYANSFYQQLVLMTVGRTETIATFNGISSGTEYSLDATSRQKLYNWIGTSLDNKGVICDLKTYTSSAMTTLVGTYSDLTYFKLPTYSLSFTTSSVADSVTAYNNYKPNSNTFIANLSKPTYTFVASSNTGSTYGRSIGYTTGSTSITSPYTNNNYTGQSLTITASDGRRTASTTPAMTHVAYFTPTLNSSVTRTTPTGSTIDISISGTYYSGTGLTNLETPTATLVYTESGGSQVSTTIPITTTTSGNTVSFTGTKQLTGMNYQKSVQWSITISDIIGITKTNSNTLPQGLPVWNGYRKNDTNYFNVNGNANIDGDLTANKVNNYRFDLLTEEKNATLFPVITYSSSLGYTLKHRSLSSTLLQLSMLYTTTGESQVSDNQTKIYQLERSGFYLFIDSHPYNNTIGVINGFAGGVNYLLQTSSSHLTFTYNTSNYQMTVKAVNGARFKIYKIEGQGNV